MKNKNKCIIHDISNDNVYSKSDNTLSESDSTCGPVGETTKSKPEKLDYSKIKNIQFDGIDYSDSPDFCDAYIIDADYNGERMTEEQLEQINDDAYFVHDRLMDYLY